MSDFNIGRFRELRLGRRAALRGGALALGGVSLAALVGCGGDEDGGDDPVPGVRGETTAVATVAPGVDQNPAQLVQQEGLPYPFGYPEPSTTPKDGGAVTVAVSWDISTMDPTRSAAGGTITVPNTSYDRLIGFVSGIHYHPLNLELKPELAESWERSPDGLVLTFKLRPEVRWHNVAPLNGRPFVAEDVAYAYRRYQSEGVHQSIWTEVDNIEAPDDATVRITLKTPLADFINNLAGRYQTIFPRELVDDGSIERTVVGTGPLIFRDAQQTQAVNFDRNPDYWGGPIHVDSFVYRIIPDLNARTAAFRAGQVEYAYAIAGRASEVEVIRGTNPDVNVHMTGGTAGGYGFGMNLQNPKFADERVRRAISLANDHRTTIALLYENYGLAAPDMPWPFLYEDAPDLQSGVLGEWVRPSGDPEQARQLLEAAGAGGLTINASYYTYGPYDATRPELLADQFRRAGITLNARRADYTEFNSQWVPGNLEEATTSGWAAPGFDADSYFYNQVHSASPGNRHKLQDSQIDAWAERQRVQLDPAARAELQQQIWDRIWLDQMYRIPQAGGYSYEIHQPWFRGFRGGGPLGTSSYFYDWGEQIPDIWLDR
ncbi:MAG: ABC transporter substrate-binding protein [Dehalococcoidia bacterium]